MGLGTGAVEVLVVVSEVELTEVEEGDLVTVLEGAEEVGVVVVEEVEEDGVF